MMETISCNIFRECTIEKGAGYHKKTEIRKTLENLECLFSTAEDMKGAYFYSPPSAALSRRSYEERHSVPEFTWSESGHEFSASYTTDCSCAHVYASGSYYKDGNKTTITALKSSHKRLLRELYGSEMPEAMIKAARTYNSGIRCNNED